MKRKQKRIRTRKKVVRMPRETLPILLQTFV